MQPGSYPARRGVLGAVAGLAATVAFAGRGRAGDTVEGGEDVGPRCVVDRRSSGSTIFDKAVRDLVIANRVLAREGAMDAYGHVSVRHPEIPGHFLIAKSVSPSLVTPADIMEFNLDGTVVGDDQRKSYVERFIHGSIYRARPDIKAVAHSHDPEVLPFTVSKTPMRVVTHSAGVDGYTFPIWDIREKFGDTNMLVDSDLKGRDLAAKLGDNTVVLMRGHGYAGTGRNLIELIRVCLYLDINARVLAGAIRLGDVIPLTPGEVRRIKDVGSGGPGLERAWRYWAQRANCTGLLTPS